MPLCHLILTSIWHRYFEAYFKPRKVRQRDSTEWRGTKSTVIQFQQGFGWVEVEESNQQKPRFQTPSQRQNQQFLCATSIKILGQSISEIAFGQFWWTIHPKLSPSQLSSMSSPHASEPKWSTLILLLHQPDFESNSDRVMGMLTTCLEDWALVTSLPRQHRSSIASSQ